MGIIGTRSFSKEIPGIVEIKEKNRTRIESGMLAVTALEALRKNKDDAAAKQHVRGAQGRPGLRPAAEEIHRGCRRGHAGNDPAGGGQHRAARRTDVLVLPRDGGAGLHLRCCCSACRCTTRCAAPSSSSAGCCAGRCGSSRCRGLPPSSAGSWRNTVASRGPSTACCPLTCRFPACRSAACTAR